MTQDPSSGTAPWWQVLLRARPASLGQTPARMVRVGRVGTAVDSDLSLTEHGPPAGHAEQLVCNSRFPCICSLRATGRHWQVCRGDAFSMIIGMSRPTGQDIRQEVV